jgi:hypothetical protein
MFSIWYFDPFIFVSITPYKVGAEPLKIRKTLSNGNLFFVDNFNNLSALRILELLSLFKFTSLFKFV